MFIFNLIMFYIETRQRRIDVVATLPYDVPKTTLRRRCSDVALRPSKSDLYATSRDVASTSRAYWGQNVTCDVLPYLLYVIFKLA